MQYLSGSVRCDDAIVDLFATSFAASEGDEAGALIGRVARDLLERTAPTDVHVVRAERDGVIVGAIIFSRLAFEQDSRTVFLCAPVAVAPGHQRRGVGQRLLTFGLQELRDVGVDIVMVYGDPAYYGKVGFLPIQQSEARAPFALAQPEGWQARSLTGRPVGRIEGPSCCVEGLSDPALW